MSPLTPLGRLNRQQSRRLCQGRTDLHGLFVPWRGNGPCADALTVIPGLDRRDAFRVAAIDLHHWIAVRGVDLPGFVMDLDLRRPAGKRWGRTPIPQLFVERCRQAEACD